MSALVKYFEKPENHLDDDKKHISKEEFKSAIGKTGEGSSDPFLYEIVFNGGYNDLRNMQKEGLVNDRQVSMRDIYTANRAYGFDGEPVLVVYEDYAKHVGVENRSSLIFQYHNQRFEFTSGPLKGKETSCSPFSSHSAGTWYNQGKNIITYIFAVDLKENSSLSRCESFRGSDIVPEESKYRFH